MGDKDRWHAPQSHNGSGTGGPRFRGCDMTHLGAWVESTPNKNKGTKSQLAGMIFAASP